MHKCLVRWSNCPAGNYFWITAASPTEVVHRQINDKRGAMWAFTKSAVENIVWIVFLPWGNVLVLIVPVGCDGCRGDHQGRVCRGSSFPCFGTFPGLWLSSTTGSQSCHPQEVWHPHIHKSKGYKSGCFLIEEIYSSLAVIHIPRQSSDPQTHRVSLSAG